MCRRRGGLITSLDPDSAEPLRGELFGVERLVHLASSLASSHAFTRRRVDNRDLLRRLAANRATLTASYQSNVAAVKERRWISPAADWLINNFHVIQEQLRESREDLPLAYYRGLPKLVGGPFSGLPRVYAMAAELVEHTDGKLEIETLRLYVAAYQAAAPLSIGELWAIPIALRLALIENLARIAVKVERASGERVAAAALAADLIRTAAGDPEQVRSILHQRVANRRQPSTTMFVSELLLRLRDQAPALEHALLWLEQRITEQGTTVDEAIRAEHHSQAQNQVSVGNSITSMRLITATDWSRFFEEESVVDAVLREDPSQHYARMDFATRDRYRHVVERIAKRTGSDEVTVARGAIQLARDASADDPRRAHVGYYLIDEGLRRFEAANGYRHTVAETVSRFVKDQATPVYLGLLALMTAAALASIFLYIRTVPASVESMWLALALALIPASELAVSLVNLGVTALLAPRVLPRLDFRSGIPSECRTFVVVPMMLTSEREIAEAIEALEVRHLANQDPCLHYALLSDFVDSAVELEPADAKLLDFAARGIARLNERHRETKDVFYLFHRSRRWNASEGKFIGWERKRGKLAQFNRLLLWGDKSGFSLIVGDESVFPQIRYVLTLDADTRLPREAACRLVGTIAHPLNSPRIDERTRTVRTGHGIVQPRISVSLESAGRSAFARLFSGQVGIDPYTSAVSDVYQDLFDEGSFVGKALYDVRAFEQTLEERVPENTLLSHDLFEGSFARSALAGVIELFDDMPSQYLAHASRRHRWTRGDWQLAPWLSRYVPEAKGRARNVLSAIARWKIADNLRRSLVAPSILLLLLGGWFFLPGSPGFWTMAVVLLVAFPAYVHVVTSMIRRPATATWSSFLHGLAAETARNVGQSALALIVLPHQAWVSLDAIGRVMVRRFVTHKHLLEWATAARAESRGSLSVVTHYRRMWPAVAVALAIGAWLVRHPSGPIALAGPLAFLWILSPYLAARLSRPAVQKPSTLSRADVLLLRQTARKTWRYFESFLRESDHFLPPDNFQEDPAPVLARRTSPTNMGLSLLATFAASDCGYTTLSACAAGVEKTLAAMARLERYRGHFFNWYDTATLKPLLPQYISTVDSGNLAGHLLTLKQGLLQAFFRPLVGRQVLDGVQDTLALLEEEAGRVVTVRHWTGDRLLKPLESEIAALSSLLEQKESSTFEWMSTIGVLSLRADAIHQRVQEIAVDRQGDDLDDLVFWGEALGEQARAREAELATLAPWLSLVRIKSGDAALDEAASELADRLVEKAEPSAFELLRQADEVRIWLGPRLEKAQANDAAATWLRALDESVREARSALSALQTRLADLSAEADALVREMDFSFLYEHERNIFSIGYSVAEGRLDASFYDLLASESRLASFVAIAKGDVPNAHWYRLGRPLVEADGGRALLSWTGTMFEYLMPYLVMKSFEGTFLDLTSRAVVRRQIEYGREAGVPWGTSEAAYNARDRQLNYQYGPFGVPGLGIKRGLGDDLVVAPYATALALPFAPDAAVANLRRLAAAGMSGRYGFYESIDYTPTRVPEGEIGAVVRAFMAHHQGMTLLAIAEYLRGDQMRQRFHAERAVQATELLLQERMPYHAPLTELNQQETEATGRAPVDTAPRRYGVAFERDAPPEVHLLSNGSYSVMVTTAGGGSSRYRDLLVTRWREDATRDHWGQFCYIRDVTSGEVWSTTYQPTLLEPHEYEVTFALDKAEFVRIEGGIASHVAISVSAEDNAEIRSVRLTNLSSRARELELTTYAEIVLSTPAADAAHTTFANLFVETEFLAGSGALLAGRRPRSPTDPSVFAVHVSALDGTAVGPLQYETDRARFLGRGRSPVSPVLIADDRPLSNTVGHVLDPIFSLRRRVRLKARESVQLAFVTAVAESRAQALQLAEKYEHLGAAARASDLTWTLAQAELHYLNVSTDDIRVFLQLASRLLYAGLELRASGETLSRNERSQSNLWAYGISGDLPILAVRVFNGSHLELVRQLLHAHEYWRLRGFSVDLVIVNDHETTYLQSFQDSILSVIRGSRERDLLDRPGGVFVLRSDLTPPEDRTLVLTVARVVLRGEYGPLLEQLEQRQIPALPAISPLPLEKLPERDDVEEVPAPHQVDFFNGLGGFSEDGREYQIALSGDQWTPAPWSNVVANSRFGTLLSESGGGYTWAENSHENRLTPWSNDAVSDPVSEAIYLRDEDTAAYFSATPLPVRGGQAYSVRHGQGYSTYETTAQDLAVRLVVFVAKDDPVKLSQLTLRNLSAERRRFTVIYYVEWTLGVSRELSAPYVVTGFDDVSSVLTARNTYAEEFKDAVAFIAATSRPRSFTGDRTEFIGRGGHLAQPIALRRGSLSGRIGPGLDPCGALQIAVELDPNEEREVAFIMGEGKDGTEAQRVAGRYRTIQAVRSALADARASWDTILNTLTVETPETAFDIMVNRWLLYQTLSSRVWGRTGFYQSGGAYGFRDQLQDVAALVYAAPGIARAQLLRAAGRQFVEGDVQHWWHPPAGKGVRTKCSDDLLWLPHVVAHYRETTHDHGILEEQLPFLEARLLEDNQDDAYLCPTISQEQGTLYDHCIRAIDRSLRTGAHGLPLIGAGDWNDGMNRVGQHGLGESVWLAWFLHSTLTKFAPICEERGDSERARLYLEHAEKLRIALEEHAWDGSWYLRAFFDDGTPLGSSRSEECQIDSLPQTWSVISGAASAARQARAMASVEQHLIRRDDELVLLFTPPFDHTAHDPGYIKGYPPGVRENGGQYTHAAVWVALAYALIGDGDRAVELLGLLNPVNHTATRADVQRYKVEPYVVAADVYAVAPHTGRGGWTWYTGSAGWMYRVAVEAVLGFHLRGDKLTLKPCIPSTWSSFSMTYRYGPSIYSIVVENPDGICRGISSIELDGIPVRGDTFTLVRDGAPHAVRVILGGDRVVESAPAGARAEAVR